MSTCFTPTRVPVLLELLSTERGMGVCAALLDGALYLSDLAEEVGIARDSQTLSATLRALKAAGIVQAERDGKEAVYSLVDDRARNAVRKIMKGVAHE